MTLTIYPRSVAGTPEPPTSRPWMARTTRKVLAHYIGVASDTRYLGADYPSPSFELDLRDAQAIARYAIAAGKAWEYSYMIGASGAVFEMAGDRKAAHCSGMNDLSYGVLFMLGIGRRPSLQMIEAWHDLIDRLKATGQISRDAELAPHYRYRWTDCPNMCAEPPQQRRPSAQTGEGWTGELIPALRARSTPTPTPSPLPPLEDDMSTARIVTLPGYANAFLVGVGAPLHLNPDLFNSYRAQNVPMVSGRADPTDPNRPHPQLLAQLLQQTGLTVADLTRI